LKKMKGKIMTAMRLLRAATDNSWRLGLCAIANVVGAGIGGALISALGMPVPESPGQAGQQVAGLLLFVASFTLAAGLIPLARRLQGSYWLRWLMLAALCYVCLGLASPLEGAIFTKLGGMESIPVLFFPLCLLFAAAVAALFKPVHAGDSPLATTLRFSRGRTLRQWAWRFLAAVFAFPVVYWTFGLMVAPFVMAYYQKGQFALSVPSPGVIVLTQFARGLLFLTASVPILILWSGSRRQLVFALGLAFTMLVGLFGLIQSYWLAPTLQILHNTEIFADSMVYALVLTLLLVPRSHTSVDETCTDHSPAVTETVVVK
jgi:hypothetical protein